jgi:hypothetical protein
VLGQNRRICDFLQAWLDAGVLLLPKPYIRSDLARMIRTALAS